MAKPLAVSGLSVEQGVDPAATAQTIKVYSKDVAGTAQLFARASDGTIYQLTPLAGRPSIDSVITPAALAANVNDYNPAGLATASMIRQDLTITTANITGIVAQPPGTLLAVHNIRPSSMRWIGIIHESGSSAAANRFNLPNHRTWWIPPLGTMVFLYDGTISRWVLWSFATCNFPADDSFGSAAITVGPPAEHLGLIREAAQTLGLNSGGTARVRIASTGADPNAFQYQSDTFFNALGQFRWASDQAIGPLSGTINNQTINSSTITARITTGGATTITGLTGGASGRMVTIVNAGADNITLNNEDAGSAVGNRLALSTASFVLAPNAACQLWYDATSSRWRKLS
jgi:hypothetical protein